jgi:hypothetical protein
MALGRCATAQQVPVACSVIHLARDKWLSNAPAGAIRFLFRIKMQHHSCDFAPISTFRIRVEQAQIRHEVSLVLSGQHGIGGRGIGDIGIKRRLLHGRSRSTFLVGQLCLGLVGILMSALRPLSPW